MTIKNDTEVSGCPEYLNPLDLQGLRCPEPIMMIRKTIRALSSGDRLFVLADDPATIRDIPNFCRFMDHALLYSQTEKSPYCYLIQKGECK